MRLGFITSGSQGFCNTILRQQQLLSRGLPSLDKQTPYHSRNTQSHSFIEENFFHKFTMQLYK